MKITPMDIEQQQFGRSFRGYNEEDVDNFLDRIAKDYEDILNENVKLKEEIEKLQSRLEEYSKMDETLRSALVNAQQSASTIKENIQRETQSMIDNAKIEADQIKQQAKQEVYNVNNEIEALKKRKHLLLEKLKNTLKLHIRMLDEEIVEEPEETGPEYIQDKSIEDLKMKIVSNEEKNMQDIPDMQEKNQDD